MIKPRTPIVEDGSGIKKPIPEADSNAHLTPQSLGTSFAATV